MPINHIARSSQAARSVVSAVIFRRAAVAFAILMAVCWAYLQMFSRFAPWDDEGLLIFEVRSLLQGHRLYNDIYAQYGPFYFVAQWFYYKAIHEPVTHDAARFLAALLWVVCSALLAWCVRRLTGSWLLAGFAFFAILRTLTAFTEGPGHPEEICLLLVCCLLLESLSIGNQGLTVLHGAAFGFLVAALTLTKVNIGFYALLALLLFCLKIASPIPFRRILFWALGCLSVVAAAAIMFPLLTLGWDRSYCLMMIFSILAACLILDGVTLNVPMRSRAWGSLILAGIVSTLLILLPFLLRGTTLPAFLWMTVFQFKDFSHRWYIALPAGGGTVLYSTISLAWAILWVWSRRSAPIRARLSFWTQILKGAAGVFSLAAMSAGRSPFVMRAAIFQVLTPLLWLVLIPPESDKASRTMCGRAVLCLVAVYLAMYPFPVAGAQVSIALAVMLVAASIFVHDAWLTLLSDVRLQSAKLRKVAAIFLLLVLTTFFTRRVATVLRDYRAMVPLNLPGAKWLRVEPKDRDTYHWLTRNIEARCDGFISVPGLLSLYSWTTKNPPTLLLAGDWMGLFNDQEKQAVADSLAPYKRACVVYNPRLVGFWQRGEDLSESPLPRYIKNNFVSVAEHRGYYFMVRKDP